MPGLVPGIHVWPIDGVETWMAGLAFGVERGSGTPEFWAAYKTQFNGDSSTGKTFNDLILAYKVSPELWVPLHDDLVDALEGWSSAPFV
jgi:hypothetical protein